MTLKVRHTIIPEVYLVLSRNDDVLLIRRAHTGFEDGMYTLVAGHVDAGESFSEALVREAHEETGIVIQPHHLKVAHVMHRKYVHEERIGVSFSVTAWEHEPCVMEPHKHDDIRWFSVNHLPEHMSAYVKVALNNIHNGEFFSELSLTA